MRESMPSTHGWIDRGPARGALLKPGYAGPVRVVPGPHGHPNLLDELELCTDLKCSQLRARAAAPYDSSQLREIVRQGKESPRPLSIEESRLVAGNRAAAGQKRTVWFIGIEHQVTTGDLTLEGDPR